MVGLRRLSSLGVRMVINLRPHDENGARDESQEVAGLGMTYINLPLTPGTFTLQKMEDFSCLARDKKNYPMFIHCRSGNRAGGTWFVYRVLFEQASIAEGMMEGRALGMEPALEPILIEFVEQMEQQKPKEVCQFESST